MTARELREYIENYIKEYPAMAENDVVFAIANGRKSRGSFYTKLPFSAIGMNTMCGGKDNLSIEFRKG